MAEVKWIKITVNMFDDEKIKLIEAMPEGDSILVIFLKLLTLAGRNNSNGYIFFQDQVPYSEEMLATIFNRKIATIRLALVTLCHIKIIEIEENGFIYIPKFEIHQNTEGLSRIKTKQNERQKRCREKAKGLIKQDNNIESHAVCHADVTCDKPLPDRDNHAIDIDNRIRVRKNIVVVVGQPQRQQVLDFFEEQKISKEEADAFWNYNTIRGWKIGRTKVSDWQVLAKQWISRIEEITSPAASAEPRTEWEIKTGDKIDTIETKAELQIYSKLVYATQDFRESSKTVQDRIIFHFENRWKYYIWYTEGWADKAKEKREREQNLGDRSEKLEEQESSSSTGSKKQDIPTQEHGNEGRNRG